MNNINRRRYVLSFRSFTYFFMLLFFIIFAVLLYFNKNMPVLSRFKVGYNFSFSLRFVAWKGTFPKDIKMLDRFLAPYVENAMVGEITFLDIYVHTMRQN